MSGCVEKSGKEFVFIIDERDALIREANGDAAVQKKYLNFLRGCSMHRLSTMRNRRRDM